MQRKQSFPPVAAEILASVDKQFETWVFRLTS
jgi:hypothetical protein